MQFFADQPLIIKVLGFFLYTTGVSVIVGMAGYYLVCATRQRSERQPVQHINPTLPITVEYKVRGVDIRIVANTAEEVHSILAEMAKAV